MNKITKKILSAAIATAVAFSFTGFLSINSNADGGCGYKLSGMAHVQDQGDTEGTFDSSTGILTLGTRGLSRRVEAVSIKIDEAPEGLIGGIEYTVHVQDYGWIIDTDGDWFKDGAMAGTSGESKRLEGIRIVLNGELGQYYDVQYQVHIQDYGDAQGFVDDGALAGTTGESKRLEEVQIKLVKRGSSEDPMSVNYRVHVQDKGWEATYAKDGASSGTTGESKRLEGIEIFLSGSQYEGGIEYRTHVQDYGWENEWAFNGQMSGTQGESKRLEAIQIRLWGEISVYYDVYYRVHSENYGWLGWAKNGESAGTAGKGLRLESIQIMLVPMGDAAPGSTDDRFIYSGDIDLSKLGATSKSGEEIEWWESDFSCVYVGWKYIDLYGSEYAQSQTCKFFYSTDPIFTDDELVATGSYNEPTNVDWCLGKLNNQYKAFMYGTQDYDDCYNEGDILDPGYYKCIVYDGSGNVIAEGTCYMM